jgi:ribokinase
MIPSSCASSLSEPRSPASRRDREPCGRLVHTGQVVLDLVMRISALPARGGDVFADTTTLTPGGGFNVMVAAVRAGAHAVYAGRHGEGRFGDTARAALTDAGIEIALPASSGIDTGICVVLVDPAGERTFVTGRGAEMDLDAAALHSVAVHRDDIVYVTGYSLIDTAPGHELVAWLPAARVLFDPGPLGGDVDPDLMARQLERTDVLSCNADEARRLGATQDLRRASKELAERLRPGGVVVVRDGAAGCLVTADGATELVAGFPVTPVDTNGAGDAHCGVLAAELLNGTDLSTAARRANAAAAIAVTRHGPATAPARAEVDALLAGTG